MTIAAPASSQLVIETRGLAKRYGPRVALDGLDLSVPRGVVYGFLGPNGAGKTTLMRILVGLIRPNAGTVSLLGEPFGWRDRARLHRVGSLIETPSFYPYLSGRDNLRAFAATGARTPVARVDEVLDFVGLRERQGDKVKGYSLGMKQRLGIASALLSDPELLLLDEPANGLDPAGIKAMRELLRYLTSLGKTVFVSSHILPEVQLLADVVGIVDRGRLVREGRLDQLLAEGAVIRVRVSTSEADRAAAVLADLSPRRTEGVAGEAAWLELRGDPREAADINRRLAEAGIFASGIESGSDLEQVFLAVTAAVPDGTPQGPPPGWGQPGAPR